jgi:hypothetical protein
MNDHRNFKGIGFYCRTCTNYIKLEFVQNKNRCGCCNGKVRFEPRHAEMNKRKVEARQQSKIMECSRCGSSKTTIRASTGKARWTNDGKCYKCYLETKSINLNITPTVI